MSNTYGVDRCLAAMNTKAIKTPPTGFSSIEAAEAQGLLWNDVRCVWENPALKAAGKGVAIDLKKGYQREKLDAMSLSELRKEVDKLRDMIPQKMREHAPKQSPPQAGAGPEDERARLSEEIGTIAAFVRSAAREVYKDKSGAEGMLLGDLCRACGKAAWELGKKLQTCAQCQSVAYCGRECQAGHWKEHKAMCKEQARMRAEMESEGTSTSKEAGEEVLNWFLSVPNVPNDVAALAWLHRAHQPVILVEGGTNARLVTCTVMPRAMWGAGELAKTWAPRFDSPAFDPNLNFFCMIVRDKARPDIPIMTPRFRFPHPPQDMDQFAAENGNKSVANLTGAPPEDKIKLYAFKPVRVRLQGLKAAELNGCEGWMVEQDEDTGRCAVQLDSGRGVKVKRGNFKFVETKNP